MTEGKCAFWLGTIAPSLCVSDFFSLAHKGGLAPGSFLEGIKLYLITVIVRKVFK